jgi:hypothetical protein
MNNAENNSKFAQFGHPGIIAQETKNGLHGQADTGIC